MPFLSPIGCITCEIFDIPMLQFYNDSQFDEFSVVFPGSQIEVTKCKGCSKPVTPADLESACDNCGSAAGNGFNNVQCPETPKDFDSNGYRLAFRHTGNEISVSDLIKLYLTGYLNGRRFIKIRLGNFRSKNF